MPDRREVIQGSAALVASSSLPVFSVSFVGTQFHRVIYDERFLASRKFAARAKRQGAVTYGIRGNVTELWYGDISRHWKRHPVAIAGMTTCSPLFGLEVVAQDYGMALAYRSEHHALPDGTVRHRYFGPSAFLRSRTGRHDGASNWAVAAADIVMDWPSAKGSEFTSLTNIKAARLRACGSDTLVSWIIAPIQRGAINRT